MNESFQATTNTAAPSGLSSGETKSPTAFRTISEVADDLALPQHVLRFWESKFKEIKPLKRGGGRRYYRPDDIKVIHDIKDLLYNQGFTIRGVQKLLRENTGSSLARSKMAQPTLPMSVQQTAPQPAPQQVAGQVIYSAPAQTLSSDKRREVEGILAELKSIRKMLAQSGI